MEPELRQCCLPQSTKIQNTAMETTNMNYKSFFFLINKAFPQPNRS